VGISSKYSWGNLKTISPRALVLSCVRRHLDGAEFKNAFVLMRKYRINMNFIYDHNPKVGWGGHCTFSLFLLSLPSLSSPLSLSVGRGWERRIIMYFYIVILIVCRCF
jgi:hypothetical protein